MADKQAETNGLGIFELVFGIWRDLTRFAFTTESPDACRDRLAEDGFTIAEKRSLVPFRPTISFEPAPTTGSIAAVTSGLSRVVRIAITVVLAFGLVTTVLLAASSEPVLNRVLILLAAYMAASAWSLFRYATVNRYCAEIRLRPGSRNKRR